MTGEPTLQVDANRLLQDLDELARIGRTPTGGVSRPALSPADVDGRAWFRQRVEAAGLVFRLDGAGNVSAVLAAERPNAPTLVAGSHLDTVPNGGCFDGALGTLAALEALRTIKEAGIRPPVHLEAIAFTDEEGNLVGLLGSQALTGQLAPGDLEKPRGGRDALERGLARLGLTRESVLAAQRPAEDLLAFVEVHIEQGTRLEETGVDIGAVTGIVGIRSYWLRFVGQAAHAGTQPMDRRADALLGTAVFVQRAHELVMAHFSPGVVNCGEVQVTPGAFNIVPAEARLALEFRHGTEAQLDEMEHALLGLARSVAADHELALQTERSSGCVATPLDESVIAAIESAADNLDLSHTRLLSFAGHDTQAMQAVTPSGLIFVPSVDGVSHHPDEFTRDEDVVNGANVLLQALLKLMPD